MQKFAFKDKLWTTTYNIQHDTHYTTQMARCFMRMHNAANFDWLVRHRQQEKME